MSPNYYFPYWPKWTTPRIYMKQFHNKHFFIIGKFESHLCFSFFSNFWKPKKVNNLSRFINSQMVTVYLQNLSKIELSDQLLSDFWAAEHFMLFSSSKIILPPFQKSLRTLSYDRLDAQSSCYVGLFRVDFFYRSKINSWFVPTNSFVCFRKVVNPIP